MIDFDALVLSRLQSLFGRPIWVWPRQSQPGHPGYWSRGDYRIQNTDIGTEEGNLSEQTLTLGVRVADFAVPLTPKDQVYVPAFKSQQAAGPFWIDDTDDDPQGHMICALKEARPDARNVNDVLPAY